MNTKKWRCIGTFCSLITAGLAGLSTCAWAGHPWSLSEVVHKALLHNPSVLRSKADRHAAERRLQIAQSGYLPTLNFTLGRGYEWTNNTVVTNNLRLWRKENGLQLNQPLFDGLDALYQIRSADAQSDSAHFALNASREEIALQATEAMLDVIQARVFVRLARENLAKHRETLKKARDKLSAGAAHQGELSLVEGRTALASATLQRLQSQLTVAKARFEAVVGEPAEAFRTTSFNKKRVPKNRATALSIAFSHSPLLKTQSARLTATGYDIKQARAAFFPTITLEMEGNNNQNLDGIRGENRDRLAMLRLNYNLFNGGADYAAWREASALNAAQHAELVRVQRQVKEQIKQDWSLWVVSRKRLSALKDHVEASKVVLKVYKNEFLIGKRQIFNVLDQENELFQSRIDYRRGLTDIDRSAYRLLATMGRLVETVFSQK